MLDDAVPDPPPSCRRLIVELERVDEDVAGHFDRTDRLHLLLALFLLLEQLALPRDVTAVTLGRDVLTLGLHRFAADDLAADC